MERSGPPGDPGPGPQQECAPISQPTPSGWNYADLWEAVAEEAADTPALVHGDRRTAWRAFDARADGVAATLLDAGVAQQDKLALYLYNGPEYLEGMFAAFKIGLVPVNTNYRYRREELRYLWENADAVAVVFHGAFTETIEELRGDLPAIRSWLFVDDGSGPCPAWATPFEEAARRGGARVRGPWGRSGDDVLMIYTGGTTGLPKGVLWRQDDVFRAYESDRGPAGEGVRERARRAARGERTVGLPACPLMHGTGFMSASFALCRAGTVVTLPGRHFEAVELLDAIERERVTRLAIVGDAFSRPIADALEARPGRWDLSSLRVVTSSGTMWSAEQKRRLEVHLPGARLIDLLGSSEAAALGHRVSGRGDTPVTAHFELGRDAFVIDDRDRPIEPGSGAIGRLVVRGRVPLGYYKDPEKSAQTFPEIDGVRCAVSGDYATVEADGTIRLLGRGAVCINTGGEKVFPEEVEEVLKTHPSVRDACVVGVPDARFGEAVAAAVELRPGAGLAPADLVAHAKESLAGYKAPRHVMVVGSIGRAPSGKADFAAVRERIATWLSGRRRS